MDCDFARGKLVALAEGDPPLPPEERAALTEHLESCAACRAELEALREQVALLRGAGEWARQLAGRIDAAGALGSGRITPGRLPRARSRRGARRRAGLPWAWLAAAAVLLVAAALVLRGRTDRGPGGRPPSGDEGVEGLRPSGHILSGEIVREGRSVGHLVAGNTYVVPAGAGAEIGMEGRARARLAGGTRFRLPADFGSRPGIDLLGGRLACSADEAFELRGRAIHARACGEFALATSQDRTVPPAPPPASGLSLSDWLFPVACAAEPINAARGEPPDATAEAAAPPGESRPEAFALLSGWAEVTVERQVFRLEGRQALVAGDGGQVAQGEPQELLAGMISTRDGLLAGLSSPRYRAIIAEFTARRAGYIERMGRQGTGAAARADLAWRVELLGKLCAAHAATLEKLNAEEGDRLAAAARLSARIEMLTGLIEVTGGRRGRE